MARVVLARSAGNALDQLDHPRAEAVLDALGVLERDRHAGYRLRGRLEGLYSYRVGAYRIIYELREPDTVRVLAIRHRGHAHRTDPR